MVATGVLHTPEHMPEKSLNDLSAEYCQTLFSANTILPALIGKHFIPHLSNDKPSCFATLTARVGSITDNRKGGWYAYRASKAALNMLIKTFAIEAQRTNPQSMIVGLHPGTVDSLLSKPFHTFIDPEKIFDPSDAATKLLSVLHTLTSDHTGKIYAWDGQEIPP